MAAFGRDATRIVHGLQLAIFQLYDPMKTGQPNNIAAQGSLKWHPALDRYTLTAAGIGVAVGVGLTQVSGCGTVHACAVHSAQMLHSEHVFGRKHLRRLASDQSAEQDAQAGCCCLQVLAGLALAMGMGSYNPRVRLRW